MEKRKLQRIIGVIIIAALIIVLTPLLVGKKESPQQEASTQTASSVSERPSSPVGTAEAPQDTVAQNATAVSATPSTNTPDMNNSNAAPNPSNIISSSAQDNGITPLNSPIESNTASASATPTMPAPVTLNSNSISPANAADSANSTQPATLSSHPNVKYSGNTGEVTTAPTDKNVPAPQTEEFTPAVNNAIQGKVHPHAKEEESAAIYTPPAKENKHPHSYTAKKTSYISAHKKTAHLTKSAWVVQMGSFKEKSNAHRLVNKLKTAGFKAFIHEMISPAGAVRTRVYVGPELKQASALKLSTQLAHKIKLQGFVVPYKPLA